MGKRARREREVCDSAIGRPHSPLPQDAIDGGFQVAHTAWWGCLLLVPEKVWR